jgi:hypothetical protein
LLSDSDRDVHKAAAQSLRYIPVESKQVLMAVLKAIDNPEFTRRRDLITAFRHQGASAIPVLCDFLTSENDGDRHQVITSLTELGRMAAPAVPALKTRLSESKPYEQRLIVNCLQAIGPAAKSAIPQMIQLLEESDGTGPLTVALASAIAHLDSEGKQAVAILINKLEFKLENSKRYWKPNQGRGSPSATGYVAPLLRQDDKGTFTDGNLCDELVLQPTQIYAWQKLLFENAAAAFAKPGRKPKTKMPRTRRSRPSRPRYKLRTKS